MISHDWIEVMTWSWLIMVNDDGIQPLSNHGIVIMNNWWAITMSVMIMIIMIGCQLVIIIWTILQLYNNITLPVIDKMMNYVTMMVTGAECMDNSVPIKTGCWHPLTVVNHGQSRLIIWYWLKNGWWFFMANHGQ